MGQKAKSEVMSLGKVIAKIGIWIRMGGRGSRDSNQNTLYICMKLANKKK